MTRNHTGGTLLSYSGCVRVLEDVESVRGWQLSQLEWGKLYLSKPYTTYKYSLLPLPKSRPLERLRILIAIILWTPHS